MGLNELRELIIKHRVKLLAALGGLIVIAIISALLFDESKEPPPPAGGEDLTFPEWSQDLGVPAQGLEGLEKLFQQVPQDFNLYSKTGTGKSYREEEALDLASRLGFGSPDYSKLETAAGPVYYFEKAGRSLTIEARPPSISYYAPGSQSLRAGVVISEDAAVSAARAFLSDLGLSPLTYLPGSYKFVFSDGEHLETTLEKSQANLVEVSFNFLRAGFPVVSSSPSKYAGVVVLNHQGDVVSFQFRDLDAEFGDPAVVGSKPFETALEEIQAGLGSVIYIEGLLGEEIELGEIGLSAFSPSKVFLAYYVDGDEVAAPVYVFKGKGTLARGGEVWATVYLPAID